MASLPRPSRPSLNPPPTGPLPSIPVSKSRQSSSSAKDVNGHIPPSPVHSSIPQNPTLRSPSSTSIPTNSSFTQAGQSAGDATGIQNGQGKTLRKTISYNSFPHPPGSRTPSLKSPAASQTTTPRSSTRGSTLFAAAPARSASLNARASGAGSGSGMQREVETKGEESSTEDSSRGRERPNSSSTKDKGNVVISVRVRPEKESPDGNAESGEWMVEGKKSVVSYRGKEGGEYVYDNVFTTHDKNAKVYDSAAKRLVRRVMEGYNGTVFAYGMTGTGKTFSMQGTASSPGVIPLAITDIFSFIRETPHREFLLRVSYLEIYNERIHDLLTMPIGQAQNGQPPDDIKLREDNKGHVYATPLKEEIVQSPTQLLRVISRGDHARRTSSTAYNVRSSRSHAVVQIVVESRERNASGPSKTEQRRTAVMPGGVRVSTLSLIDLAGSERAAETKERRTEGAHINKSLLTLGTVISKLSGSKDKQGQPTDKDGKHLPYRDSKLTRLLQPALSGNSLISILCTIQLGSHGSSALAGNHTIETLNTLKFAARARNNIVSHAKKAEEAHSGVGDAGSRALLDRYRVEILQLRKQLEEQKSGVQKAKDEEEEKAREVEAEQRHEEQIIEMQLARTALKERIEHLNRLILSSKSIGVNVRQSSSTLSLAQQRMSTMSNMTDGTSRSIRSSASMQTLDSNPNRGSTGSGGVNVATPALQGEDEEDTYGENGDGTASMAVQVRSLQADLADKNRYISTLEKRLIQARRSSRSRVSMAFTPRGSLGSSEESNVETLLREKDNEIAELREKLDDKDRMVAALRSAARKRDAVETSATSGDTTPVSEQKSSNLATTGPIPINGVRKRSDDRRRSTESYRSSMISPPTTTYDRRSSAGPGTLPNGNYNPSPAKILRAGATSPSRQKRNHGVDEMTRMLDDMIRQKMESDHRSNTPSRSSSIVNGITSPNVTIQNGKNGVRSPGSRANTNTSGLSGWEPGASRRSTSSSSSRRDDHSFSHKKRKSSFVNGIPEGNEGEVDDTNGNVDGMNSQNPPSTSSSPSIQTPNTQENYHPSHRYSISTTAAARATDVLRPATAIRNRREYESSDIQSTSTPTTQESDGSGSSIYQPTADSSMAKVNNIISGSASHI